MGSLLFFFFDFPFAQATGLSFRGLSAKQHRMLFGGDEQKANLSEHLVAMLEGGSRAPLPGLCSPILWPSTHSVCEFLPLCDFRFLAMISLMPGLVLKGALCAMVVCDCLLTISLLCSLEQVPWPLCFVIEWADWMKVRVLLIWTGSSMLYPGYPGMRAKVSATCMAIWI